MNTAQNKQSNNQKYEKVLKIRNYFLNLNRDNVDQEILEIIEFLGNNLFSVFPYNFINKYNPNEIKVYYDEESEMKYVLHDNKRLYFPKGWSWGAISNYYNDLCIEQDMDSPHRYETPEYTVKEGDIIADIGAAEGIWALTYAERAKKIYLFECDPDWLVALKKTFEPWKEKVIIANRYISDTSTKNYIALDDFIGSREINFIKADIEGMEVKLLMGGKKTLTEAVDLKLLLCAYHRKDDAENLRSFLETNGFITEFSKRYMLFILDKELDEPYIRRGLIRATKIKTH
jgi:hypothetical protein